MEKFIEDERGNKYFANRNGNAFEVVIYEPEKNIAILKPLRYSDEKMIVVATGLHSDYWENGYYCETLNDAAKQYNKLVTR